MDSRKIAALRRRIAQLRRGAGNVNHQKLASVAKALGRRRDTSRGKEPTFVSNKEGWLPLSIPDHPGTLRKGTVFNILEILEDDLLALEEESSHWEGQ